MGVGVQAGWRCWIWSGGAGQSLTSSLPDLETPLLGMGLGGAWSRGRGIGKKAGALGAQGVGRAKGGERGGAGRMEGAWRGRRWVAELGRGRKSSAIHTPGLWVYISFLSLFLPASLSFPSSFLPSLFLSPFFLRLPLTVSPVSFSTFVFPFPCLRYLFISGLTLWLFNFCLCLSRGPSLHVSLSPSLCLSDSVSFCF